MKQKPTAIASFICLLLALIQALSGCAWFRVRRLERSSETVTVGTYQLDTLVHAPPEKVFDFLFHWKDIERPAGAAEPEPPAPNNELRLGELVDTTIPLFGVRLPIRSAIVQFDRPRSLILAAAKGMRGWNIIRLQPEDDGTRVQADLHLFFVPDTARGLLGGVVLKSQSQSQRLTKRAMSQVYKEVIGAIENRDPKTVRLEHEKVKRFVDAYFLVEETFSLPPQELYPALASAEGLNRVFAGHIAFTPSPDSSGAPFGAGSCFTAAAAVGAEQTLTYNAIVIQAESGKQFRMVVPSRDAIMEWDFLLGPTRKGSKLIVLMITYYTESSDAATFDTILLTSQMDRWVREGLAGLPGRLEKTER